MTTSRRGRRRVQLGQTSRASVRGGPKLQLSTARDLLATPSRSDAPAEPYRSDARAGEPRPAVEETCSRPDLDGSDGAEVRRAKRANPLGPRREAVSRVPRDGIEPPTRGFSVPCSTN
jgi:hypothetical protein